MKQMDFKLVKFAGDSIEMVMHLGALARDYLTIQKPRRNNRNKIIIEITDKLLIILFTINKQIKNKDINLDLDNLLMTSCLYEITNNEVLSVDKTKSLFEGCTYTVKQALALINRTNFLHYRDTMKVITFQAGYLTFDKSRQVILADEDSGGYDGIEITRTEDNVGIFVSALENSRSNIKILDRNFNLTTLSKIILFEYDYNKITDNEKIFLEITRAVKNKEINTRSFATTESSNVGKIIRKIIFPEEIIPLEKMYSLNVEQISMLGESEVENKEITNDLQEQKASGINPINEINEVGKKVNQTITNMYLDADEKNRKLIIEDFEKIFYIILGLEDFSIYKMEEISLNFFDNHEEPIKNVVEKHFFEFIDNSKSAYTKMILDGLNEEMPINITFNQKQGFISIEDFATGFNILNSIEIVGRDEVQIGKDNQYFIEEKRIAINELNKYPFSKLIAEIFLTMFIEGEGNISDLEFEIDNLIIDESRKIITTRYSNDENGFPFTFNMNLATKKMNFNSSESRNVDYGNINQDKITGFDFDTE
ncbi:hypothetical protein FQA39_LY12869 [Lamprigera yunnana]|nr:hypothetical protein FQA39_LY12869 [Lamprigera yunnana]